MSHPVDIHVGKKLKSLRILRGLTQTDVANGLHISFQQVQKYELGRNRISASKLFEISKILVVEPKYFFDGLDDGGTSEPLINEDDAKLLSTITRIPNGTVKTRLIAMADAFACTAAQQVAA